MLTKHGKSLSNLTTSKNTMKWNIGTNIFVLIFQCDAFCSVFWEKLCVFAFSFFFASMALLVVISSFATSQSPSVCVPWCGLVSWNCYLSEIVLSSFCFQCPSSLPVDVVQHLCTRHTLLLWLNLVSSVLHICLIWSEPEFNSFPQTQYYWRVPWNLHVHFHHQHECSFHTNLTNWTLT